MKGSLILFIICCICFILQLVDIVIVDIPFVYSRIDTIIILVIAIILNGINYKL